MQVKHVGTLLGVGALVGLTCGLASSLFLWLLDLATRTREAHEVMIFALPLAGLVLGWVYERFAGVANRGTNLVIETIRDGGGPLPARMAPMILAGTVVTHAFGGSAGREGTAVQMGSSLADSLAALFRWSARSRRYALVAGVAGGFGSVFGTPLAGVIFALELSKADELDLWAVLPALVAALVGDWVTRSLGTVHTSYLQFSAASYELTVRLALAWVVFAAAIAATAWAFIKSIEVLRQIRGHRAIRMFIGGAAIVGLWRAFGTSDYLGLGMPFIVRSFTQSVPGYAFLAKGLFTVITLGAGFLGGEVTTLFFIGAALGNTLALPLGVPLELAVGAGLASMFGAAAKTPLAVSVMAFELMGAGIFMHVVVVALLASAMLGRHSIYSSQLQAP